MAKDQGTQVKEKAHGSRAKAKDQARYEMVSDQSWIATKGKAKGTKTTAKGRWRKKAMTFFHKSSRAIGDGERSIMESNKR